MTTRLQRPSIHTCTITHNQRVFSTKKLFFVNFLLAKAEAEAIDHLALIHQREIVSGILRWEHGPEDSNAVNIPLRSFMERGCHPLSHKQSLQFRTRKLAQDLVRK
ncbi:hypothetical protein NPIL_372021 [Nephila pilipes]|uniref:Uncharacterized protein n=1 Tax=Nephila pilipes TaxID=299642 RepID=A0A8X6QKK6_NEPPI|nr:hypothetical protein NPIL_372021 [Nephila pilipes]